MGQGGGAKRPDRFSPGALEKPEKTLLVPGELRVKRKLYFKENIAPVAKCLIYRNLL